MEMSMAIYTNAPGTADSRFDYDDNLYEDVNENLRICRSGNPGKSESSGRGTAERRWCRPTVVCIVLLGVLLLVAVTVLCVKSNNQAAENNRSESQRQDSNWQAERDHYSNLSAENDQLQSRYNDLSVENDQIQSGYNNLTVETKQLQTRYNSLTMEKKQLQTSYNSLTVEKNQLQTRYNNLTVEKKQLQTRYNNLTVEKKQLESNYHNLTIEKNQLQTRYNNMTVVKNQLQTRYNNVNAEKNQLQTRYNNLLIEWNQLQKEKAELEKQRSALEQGWRYFNSRLYYFSTDTKTWSESRQDCKRRGADLVIVNTKEEQVFLNNNMDRMDAWIGLSDLDAEGQWRWVDGTKPTLELWRPGEPNNTGQEDCGEIYGLPVDKGWNDSMCTVRKAWICEKSGSNQ